jgi:hypothetical protein
MENVTAVADDIWNELVEASSIEPPTQIKGYYDNVVKKEDPSNPKVSIDFKKPSEMTAEVFLSIPAKSNWSSNIKYCFHFINKFSADRPIRLCHLLMLLAYRLKIFWDDAFGKVASRCKLSASIVSFLMEKHIVFFFSSGAARNRQPIHARPLNDETFKAAVVDLLKCTNDTNLQCHYMGDGAGNEELAGLGIPPSALTDGSLPNAETLFKCSLHEVKALYDSKQYLKNPNATEAAAARLQAQVLDGIARVANGQPVNSSSESSLTTEETPQQISEKSPASNNDNDKRKNFSGSCHG